jgi:hypothetical protein
MIKESKRPIEKGEWIINKLGMAPYNLVENHNNKIVRKIGMFVSFLWLPLVMTPFIPYFLYNILEELLYDA